VPLGEIIVSPVATSRTRGALGDRILTVQIPDNGPAQLGVAFEILTGVVVPLGV
jgi:hypothetical protein